LPSDDLRLRELLDIPGGSEHLFRSGANPRVFGEILPAHNLRAIDEELCWTGNVMAIVPRRSVQQPEGTDYIQIRVGKEREGETRFAAQGGGNLWRVHADGYRPNALRLEFLKVTLNAS
jgi:hypothetical protein